MPREKPAPFTLHSPEHFKALGHPVRHRIVNLLRQRPATLRQLTAALEMPKGTVAYHVGVLQEAGMVQVVETRQVRGGTERYLGLPSQGFKFKMGQSAEFLYRAALAEMLPDDEHGAEKTILRHLWLTEDQARTLLAELRHMMPRTDLSSPAEGDAYGLLVSLFRADIPALPPDEQDETESVG
jgi:DNA-binding transcriptional ArsR family regulator